MKLVFLIFCPLLAFSAGVDTRMGGSSSMAENSDIYRNRDSYVPPPELNDLEELNPIMFTDSKELTKELQKVKFLLINGDLELAKVHLSKLAYNNSKLAPVIHRYTAIAAFIEGDFRKSYEFLSKKDLDLYPHFNRVCTLRVLTQIVLNLTNDLAAVWKRCREETFNNFIPENLYWIEALVELKLRPRTGVSKLPFKAVVLESLDNHELKIFLKLAMYLNQEHLALEAIPNFSYVQLQDTELREILGQIYFRTGSFVNAYKYVKDLSTPNAENIKGNLYILQDKYELAYAQFKLALNLKQNSQNAMERLLPLAWLLGDWVNGAQYAARVIPAPQTSINKLALAAAFQVQKGSFTEARTILDAISQRSRRGTELDVTQLYSFSALMQNKISESRKQAGLSCGQYDLQNCWLLYQYSQWDAFPVMVRRDEAIVHKSEWEKLTKEDITKPLTETVYVNQIDIEELDDKLIELIPKKSP